MGREAKAKQARKAQAQPVTLPEAQYFRLMNLVKDVRIEAQRANAAIAEAKSRVSAKEAARNAYMAELQQAYPALDFQAVVYAGDDASCTLTPRGKGAGE